MKRALASLLTVSGRFPHHDLSSFQRGCDAAEAAKSKIKLG